MLVFAWVVPNSSDCRPKGYPGLSARKLPHVSGGERNPIAMSRDRWACFGLAVLVAMEAATLTVRFPRIRPAVLSLPRCERADNLVRRLETGALSSVLSAVHLPSVATFSDLRTQELVSPSTQCCSVRSPDPVSKNERVEASTSARGGTASLPPVKGSSTRRLGYVAGACL
jgi:hypothetical protein